MAIAPQVGSTAASSVSVATLALGALTLTAGWDVIVAVALGSTSSSVSSITDTKGNTYSLVAAVNGTGVRTEIWASHNVGAQVSDVITVNLSAATTIAVAAEAYSGVSAEGGHATTSGSGTVIQGEVATVEVNDWAVAAFGFVCNSGDTLTAFFGTSRASIIPAATAVGVALFDIAMIADATAMLLSGISASRNWASAAVELESGGAGLSPSGYAGAIVATPCTAISLELVMEDYGGAIVPSLGNSSVLETLFEPPFANEQPNNYGFVF